MGSASSGDERHPRPQSSQPVIRPSVEPDVPICAATRMAMAVVLARRSVLGHRREIAEYALVVTAAQTRRRAPIAEICGAPWSRGNVAAPAVAGSSQHPSGS